MEQCLNYIETKFDYVCSLLEHLYLVLKSEIVIVENFYIKQEDTDNLIKNLKSQVQVEQAILDKINRIGNPFHAVFHMLATGEHIIRKMDSREKKLYKRMGSIMGQIFSGEKEKGIAYTWVEIVANGVEDKIHEGVANGLFPGYHTDIDFEFVNKPEFVAFAREVITEVSNKPVSDKVINTFVKIFREWFNERD